MALPALLLAAAVATWAVDPATEGALVEDHRAPAVTIVVELPVGRFSPWGRAHHAAEAFELMDRDPEHALGKRSDALAAGLTLQMTNRAATLRATCLKSNFAETLGLVRDVLANAHYDRSELARAKHEQAILWRGRDTDVAFRVRQAAARALFAEGDPRRLAYEKPPSIVTDPAVLGATRDALLRWPGRRVGFAGDVTEPEAREAAAGLLPPPAPSAPPDLQPEFLALREPSGDATAADVAIRRLTQVYLLDARGSVPWDDPRRPAALVADHVLAGHFYARLWVALRHAGGDTYGVATIDEGNRVPGIYGAATYTRVANAGVIEGKLLDALKIFDEQGITEAERADAVSYLTGHLAFGRQSPEQILSRYLAERRFDLPPGAEDDLVARAARLPLAEINAFIKTYYDPRRFTMIRAVPK
jgi:predicted Zn-dependent peptidase